MNELLELTEEEIKELQEQFSTITKTDGNTIVKKDWLDDSVQVIKQK